MLKSLRAELTELKLRSIPQLIFIASICIALFCLSIFLELKFSELRVLFCEEPRVDFAGLTSQQMDDVKCAWYLPDGPDLNCCAHRLSGTNSWQMLSGFIGRMHVEVTPAVVDKLEHISVNFGDEHYEFPKPVFQNWTNCGAIEHNGHSWLVFENDNFPGHAYSSASLGYHIAYLTRMVRPYLIMVVMSSLLVFLFFRLSRSQAFLREAAVGLLGPIKRRPTGDRWFWLGLASVAIAIVSLECESRYFFLQDDNVAQFMPVIMQGGESFLNGIFPVWNPYQYLGAPTCSLGVYALTYPVTYISYAIADRFLHSQLWTIEIFASIHLLCGYAAMYALLRSMNLRSSLSALAAVSFVLNGYLIIMGRSWYYMFPAVVWAPLLVLLINRLFKNDVGVRWTIATGLVIGVFFHAGNAQIWAYALMLCAITVILALATGILPRSRVKWCTPAVLIGIAVAAPLAVIQSQEIASAARSGDPGFLSGLAWPNLFLPLGDLWADIYKAYIVHIVSYPHELCYFGTAFAVCALGAVWFILCRFMLFRGSARLYAAIFGRNIWLPAMVISLILVCGSEGILWDLSAKFPVLDKFSQSAKYLIYVAMFGIIAAALIIERYLTVVKTPGKAMCAIAVLSSCLMVLHLAQCNTVICYYADSSYPPLPEAIAGTLSTGAKDGKPQRFFPITAKRSAEPGFYQALNLNFATVYKMLTIQGYDPLIGFRPDSSRIGHIFINRPWDAARNYGVRWLLVHEPGRKSNFSRASWDEPMTADSYLIPATIRSFFNAVSPQYTKIVDLPHGGIYENKQVSPMAFTRLHPEKALPIQLQCDGVTVDVSSVTAGDTVVVNFERRPWFVATLDGQQIELVPDDYYRLAITLPTAGHNLKFTYVLPWSAGLSLAMPLGLAGILLALLMHYSSMPTPRRRRKQRGTAAAGATIRNERP